MRVDSVPVLATKFDTACESICGVAEDSNDESATRSESITKAESKTKDDPTNTASTKCQAGCCESKAASIAYRLAGTKQENLTCTLSGNELKHRARLTQKILLANAEKIIELDNGYRFLFSADDDELVRGLTEWVIAERKCCSFFRFSMTIEPNDRLTFELTGQPEAKEIMDSLVQKKIKVSAE